MIPSDLDALDPAAVAALVGLTVTRGRAPGGGVCCSPCPACGAERAHGRRGEKRGAIALAGGWRCWQCSVTGSRADLCARVRTGRPWAALDGPERRAMLEGLGGATAAPARPWTPAPVRYLEPETWAAIVSASAPASSDRACRKWASGRGLRLARSLIALPVEPVADLPLWSTAEDRDPIWLPAMGYRLGLPLCDHTGRIVSLRLRSVTGARLKEMSLPGYGSAGTVYAPWTVREAWMQELPCPRPCVLVEGGPDWLAAGGAWYRERDVIGYLSGSMSGQPWARWLGQLHPDTIMVSQQDELSAEQRARGITVAAGQRYAAQIREAAPWVRDVGMPRVYAAAGAEWKIGRDLADLRRLPEIVEIIS